MNANDLLYLMQNGARLRTDYRYNTMKLINTLTMPNGERMRIQDSLIDPLVGKKKLRVIYYQAGIKDYKVNDPTD